MQQHHAMGVAIRSHREAAGYSLRTLCDRLATFGLNWNRETLRSVETAARGLQVHELLVIAAALGVSPDVLALPPGDEREGIDLSDTYTVEPSHARRWWSGEHGPPMVRPSSPGELAWPIPDEVPRSPEGARERYERWRRTRPRSEVLQRVALEERPEVAAALKAADVVRGRLTRSSVHGEERGLADAMKRLASSARAALEATDPEAIHEDDEQRQRQAALRDAVLGTDDEEDER